MPSRPSFMLSLKTWLSEGPNIASLRRMGSCDARALARVEDLR